MITKLPASKPFDPSHLAGITFWWHATPDGLKDMATGEIVAPTVFRNGRWACLAADFNAAAAKHFPAPDHVVTAPPAPAP